MTRVLFIAGHSHSGSTLLEMMLSAHPRVCGVGETAIFLDPVSRPLYLATLDLRRCSCGERLRECPLWSGYIAYLQATPTADFAAAYERLLADVRRLCGEDTIVADSSKYLAHLDQRADNLEHATSSQPQFYVIHLVRDVRGFATSLKRRDRTSGPRAALRSWRRFTVWNRDNSALERYLATSDLPHMRIGYEELCADPRRTLETVCARAGLEFVPGMLDLANSSGHIGLGNPMRYQPEKRFAVRYDDRWRSELAIRWIYRLRGAVRRYNESVVYKNLGPGEEP